MNINGIITRNAPWAHLPSALLVAFLARMPAAVATLRIAMTSTRPPTVVVLRAIALTALATEPLHAQTGATQFVVSQSHPIQGTVGEPLSAAFTINAAPSRPNQFFIDSPLPPGLVTIPAITGNRVSSGTPVITGTPTQAGTYSVNVTGSDGFHAMSHTLTFEIAAPPSPGRLAQFSILTELTAADPVLTVNTTIEGRSEAGTLLVRAAGPSLASVGVTAPLANPRLELTSGPTSVRSNDDWRGDPMLQNLFVRLGAFPFVDPTSADAALAAPVANRDTTIHVNASDNSTGFVLLEAFIARPTASDHADQRWTNGIVRHGIRADAPLILGFTIEGSSATTLAFHSGGESANAVIELALFDSSGTPAAPVSSSLLVALPPGAYSLHVRTTAAHESIFLEWNEVP
jgi:hypothetical protein